MRNSFACSLVAYDKTVGSPVRFVVLIQKQAVITSKGFLESAFYQKNIDRDMFNVLKNGIRYNNVFSLHNDSFMYGMRIVLSLEEGNEAESEEISR